MLRGFESQAITDLYAKHRPGYSQDIINIVMDYVKATNKLTKSGQEESKFELLVDVGCGSGQATNLFAPFFQRVKGVDISSNQILEAKMQNKLSHVYYVQGSAESIPVPDNVADLVLSATSAHWFDLPKFYLETQRVLKKNGCLAVLCPCLPRIEPSSLPLGNEVEMGKYATKLFEKHVFSGVYNEKVYSYPVRKYKDVFEAIPSDDKVYVGDVNNYYQSTLECIVGQLKSFDSTQNHLEQKLKECRTAGMEITSDLVNSLDLSEQFRQKVNAAWKIEDVADAEVLVNVETDMYILLAHNLHG